MIASAQLKTSLEVSHVAWANITTLRDLHDNLQPLEFRQYTWSPEPQFSPIGAHTRHITDHYDCFFSGLVTDFIDYDNRSREKNTETNVSLALQTIADFEQQLFELDYHLGHPLNISVTADPDSPAVCAASNLERELLFLQSHTLHHMAIIKLLLRCQNIESNNFFGTAPSTIKAQGHHD